MFAAGYSRAEKGKTVLIARVRKLSRLRIAAVLVCLSLPPLTSLRHYRADRRMHLVMRLKSSVDSQAQLFYDTGAGFTENDSQTLPVLAADSFSTLHYT